MTAVATLAAANAALALAETLIPQIASLVQSGEVSKEEQSALLNRYEALKNATAEHFTGPEWEVDS